MWSTTDFRNFINGCGKIPKVIYKFTYYIAAMETNGIWEMVKSVTTCCCYTEYGGCYVLHNIHGNQVIRKENVISIETITE